MGSKVASILVAVIGAAVIADFLIHPAGTLAAGNAANSVLVPSYSAVLGAVPGYSSNTKVPS